MRRATSEAAGPRLRRHDGFASALLGLCVSVFDAWHRRDDGRASLACACGTDRERYPHDDREHGGGAEDGERRREIDTEHERRPSVARSLVFAIALASIALGVASPEIALAAEPVRYDIEAVVDRGAAVVRIEMSVEVALVRGEGEVRFWLYADRLAVAPDAMEERSWRWIFPGEVDLGGVHIERVAVDGAEATFEIELASERDRAGSDLVVAVGRAPESEEADAPRTVLVTLACTLDVPDRFGRLGRDGTDGLLDPGVVSLVAPWYPLVVDRARDAGLDAWAFDVPHRVHVRVVDGEVALGAGVGPDVTVERVGPYVPALAARHLYVRHASIEGIDLAFVADHIEHTPPDAPGIDGVDDFIELDRVALETAVIADVVRTARWLEAPIPEPLVVTTAALRTELTGVAPGTALVSDRLFQVLPLDEVREFHRRALRRAVFGLIADEISRRVEPPADRGWASDLRAVVLLDLDEARRSTTAERPEDLLALFSFHPAIDQLLYAPQTTFETAYFGAIDDPDRFHDDPTRARRAVTGGRRILECARDVLDEEEMRRFIARLAAGRRSVEEALLRIDQDAALRIPGWLAYGEREVNYRLGRVTSERTEAGTHRHVVEVFRDGDERPEPVEIEVVDASGNRVVVRWEATADRGEVAVDTPAELAGVTIDPRHRLPESARVADGHPRADDTTALSWRPPILSAFSLDILGSEANVTGLVDFALRQRYDLEHTVTIRLARSAARTGGRIRYLQGLGPKVHTNRRIGLFGGGAGLNYITPGFGGSTLGGWAVDAELLGSVDSRAFVNDPRGGYSLFAQVLVSGTIRQDGQFFVGARGGLRASVIVPVGLLNAFFFGVGAGFSAGPSLDADRVGLGGRNGLRGFANGELLGSGVLFAVVEHRWTVASDLAMNILHLVWAREVQLAWWVGGGAVFDTPGRALADGTMMPGETAHGALEAGAGLRFHYEYGGIQPGVLALDFGVPLSRYWEGANSTRAPVGFYVGFDQYF